MAELSGFWTTGGTVGDQQTSYTQAQWSTAAKILSACSGFEGVAAGYLNALAGTVTGANTVAINTGGALVDGKWFLNDASQDVNIPSASGGGNTRIDRIVLRATWASFNVSVTRIAGTDAASPTAPAITQTSGTTYDILLYQALVDTAGTVTLTDERVYASQFVHNRQGGHATAWATPGTNNYTPGPARIQTGVVTAGSIAAGAEASVSVTFPQPFRYTPVVVVSPGGPAGDECTAWTTFSYTSTAFTGWVRNISSAEKEFYLFWIAIGQ